VKDFFQERTQIVFASIFAENSARRAPEFRSKRAMRRKSKRPILRTDRGPSHQPSLSRAMPPHARADSTAPRGANRIAPATATIGARARKLGPMETEIDGR
jgi:hypothetical protein